MAKRAGGVVVGKAVTNLYGFDNNDQKENDRDDRKSGRQRFVSTQRKKMAGKCLHLQKILVSLTY